MNIQPFVLKKQISIIGCGWLGFSLAKSLINEDYSVKGSTTSMDKLELLKNESIEGYLINLNAAGISGNYSGFFANSETLIINIPPGLRRNPSKNHVAEIKHLIAVIEKQHIKNVLYISSTSVFKNENHFPKITDTTLPNATSNSGKQLIEIEQLLLSNTNFNTTILRFGGLFDETRHPAKYLSGKVNIANPNAPINLIHKQDCIAIMVAIINNDHWNCTLNAAYPGHPKKSIYYSAYCKIHNLPLPTFNSLIKSKGKIIDSSKLAMLLNYTFKIAP